MKIIQKLEATAGIEPAYTDLQSAASPLRHVALQSPSNGRANVRGRLRKHATSWQKPGCATTSGPCITRRVGSANGSYRAARFHQAAGIVELVKGEENGR